SSMAAEETMSGCLVDVRVDRSCPEQGPMLTHDLNPEGGLSRSLDARLTSLGQGLRRSAVASAKTGSLALPPRCRRDLRARVDRAVGLTPLTPCGRCALSVSGGPGVPAGARLPWRGWLWPQRSRDGSRGRAGIHPPLPRPTR